jgi:NADP-dependent 3-hydroxy acid dehydrogenase YdfG
MPQDRRVAAVVGATGGIGRGVVEALKNDYTLWLVGRDLPALSALAETLPSAHVWTLDLACGDDSPKVPEELEILDVLVQAAGQFEYGSVENTPRSSWRQVFEVNLFGVTELTRVLLPALRRAAGRAIFVNSTAVTGAPENRAAYASSRAALRQFTEALHREELENGIRVTSILLGRVDTERQRFVRQKEGGAYEPHRYMSVESTADVISWIVSAPDDVHVTELVVRPRWIA